MTNKQLKDAWYSMKQEATEKMGRCFDGRYTNEYWRLKGRVDCLEEIINLLKQED